MTEAEIHSPAPLSRTVTRSLLLSGSALFALSAPAVYAQASPAPFPAAELAVAEEAGAEQQANQASADQSDEDARPITLMAGDVDPFGGTIDPFGGAIDPFGGAIDPFGGTIDPFGGTINPFHGEVRVLWGTIDPFGGTIDPFGGTIDPFGGTINPFYGDIDPHKGLIDPFSGIELPSYLDTNAFWHSFGTKWVDVNLLMQDIQENGETSGKRAALGAALGELIAQSRETWGEAVEARTGESFDEAFILPLLNKNGIQDGSIDDLLALDAGQRAQLVTQWFDGLMDYTGYDHFDHWMGAINWTPDLTNVQGGGEDSVIGILDSSVTDDPDLVGNVFSSGGYDAKVNGHGSGVASLLVGAHDGRGIMGIAPRASVATYNPFDDTGTASWRDIEEGIKALKHDGASVINMSLGITGWTLHPEWNEVFQDKNVKKAIKDTVFVIAAGNDGSSQTENIEWKENKDFGLLIVGSVDPNGNISDFSNRPGSACFAKKGECEEKLGYLRDRFIVAPGEFILVSDGEGGLVRRSGTSFAAPLVSGAITLLHDRWPWLAEEPGATAEIILGSAYDLGEEGVDDVYGVGLLDVEASQSPLDFNNLEFFERGTLTAEEKQKGKEAKLEKRKADEILSGGIGESWDAEGMYMVVFEEVGDTKRDFLIPLSDQLVGQKTATEDSMEYFQSYLRSRFVRWVDSRGRNKTGGKKGGKKGRGFTDLATIESPNPTGWKYAVSATSPVSYLTGGNDAQVPHSSVSLTSPDGKFAFTSGFGEGAMNLIGQNAFGLTTDYSSNDGGVNPLLGLASGGGFFDAQYNLDDRTTIALGLTNRKLDHSENFDLTQTERSQLRDVDDYSASAWNLRVTHRPTDAISLSLSAASLDEQNGLMGVQSVIDSHLRDGSRSTTLTFGGSFDLPGDITLAASATAGLTRTGDARDQAINTGGLGVVSSAYAASATKLGILGKNDRLRLSLAQPLHVETGELEYTSIEVVDRQTGEIGEVTHSFDIAGDKRRYVAEVIYSAPVTKRGEFSLFGRGETAGSASVANQFVVGGVLSLSF